MHDPAPTIFVVDDDEPVRRALSRLVRTWGYDVASFADPRSFLDTPRPEGASCAILDLQMPSLSGLELQAEMANRGRGDPVIFLTGQGDIPSTVQAMQGGAVDFLEKPVEDAVLRAAVSRALERSAAKRQEEEALSGARRRLASLTPRELETMRCVITGQPNKVIAYRLGITMRTVKAHRHQVMEKMIVRSVAELVRVAEALGVEPDND